MAPGLGVWFGTRDEAPAHPGTPLVGRPRQPRNLGTRRLPERKRASGRIGVGIVAVGERPPGGASAAERRLVNAASALLDEPSSGFASGPSLRLSVRTSPRAPSPPLLSTRSIGPPSRVERQAGGGRGGWRPFRRDALGAEGRAGAHRAQPARGSRGAPPGGGNGAPNQKASAVAPLSARTRIRAMPSATVGMAPRAIQKSA
jgi:hypothetical protein